MNYILPTFLIPGAGKSGTSYLAEILRQHPDILMSISKEPAFFSKYKGAGLYCKGFDFYQKNFVGYQGQKHIGEASTVYMYDPASPSLIHQVIPNAKLIFILRNPIDRVYSNYWQDIKSGKQLDDFGSFLVAGGDRIKEMIYVSQYHIHLARYFKQFARCNVLVLLYKDLKKNRLGTINKVLSFLDLDNLPDHVNLDIVVNPAARPRSRIVARLLRQRSLTQFIKGIIPSSFAFQAKSLLNILRATNQKPFRYSPMDEESREILLEEFSSGVEVLAQMIEMDLSFWLE